MKRIREEFKGEKIVTKHEWMIAAIQALEEISTSHKEDPAMSLYETLFIDPKKLTPFQQRQLEY